MANARHSYPGGTILFLNMMEAAYLKKRTVFGNDILAACIPILGVALVMLVFMMPSNIMIECQNVPGGDMCRIVTE